MTILERLKSSCEKCCDLHFECRKWGDGSSAEGVTNIVCDDLGIVIASDVEEAVAELFVALNNSAPALLEVVEVLQALNRRGGLGLDVHEIINTALAKLEADDA
jgi:hypothetical protein